MFPLVTATVGLQFCDHFKLVVTSQQTSATTSAEGFYVNDVFADCTTGKVDGKTINGYEIGSRIALDGDNCLCTTCGNEQTCMSATYEKPTGQCRLFLPRFLGPFLLTTQQKTDEPKTFDFR